MVRVVSAVARCSIHRTRPRHSPSRDGVTPIELVDGDKLVEMFEMFEIGLKPTKTYVVDYKFFEEFKGLGA